MSMQIDIKNMSKINNVKQETFKIYENFIKHKKTSSDNEKHLF
jgi:hypothetical protein